MRKLSSVWLVALAVTLVTAGVARAGSVQEEVQGEDVGERLYLTYCASCHGPDGKGQGTLAAILDIEPADLTQFARANGGVFPFRSVLRAIDGRMTVRAHGDSAMPVWGEVFSPPPDASIREQLESFGRMFLITFYVESLQAPADPPE